MSFWDMLMGQAGGPSTLATTPHAPHPAAPMGGPTHMQGLPEMLPVGVPLPPPRPPSVGKDQARMGLDTTGLAAILNQRATHWPLEDMDRVVGEERTGYPLAPLDMHGGKTGFVDLSFIGPPAPVEYANMPRRNEMTSDSFGRVMDPNTPVGEDEYRALIKRLFEVQQPGFGGSQWR